MNPLLGVFLHAIGGFASASFYVPIKFVKKWSWEVAWLAMGLVAWLITPMVAAAITMPTGFSAIAQTDVSVLLLTALFGGMWGFGNVTYGLSMRYLGVALGQSLALGTCAGLGTILTPLFLGKPGDLTTSVIIGVLVTLAGIAVIGIAGHMKSSALSEEEKKKAVKDFNFPKGIAVALLAGFMSACFNIGLGFGENLNFGDRTDVIFRSLPATFLVTLGGFFTNAVYCLYQNARNRSFGDYAKGGLWLNNAVFCALAGVLWYSQFFGLSLGKGFLTGSPALMTFSWCILMALNVTFSNVWGIILKEWKGCSSRTIAVLVTGIMILIVSSFLPELLK